MENLCIIEQCLIFFFVSIRCIYDRKVSGLPDLSIGINEKCLEDRESYESLIGDYLHHFSIIADDTINCGPILNWFQMDNKGF